MSETILKTPREESTIPRRTAAAELLKKIQMQNNILIAYIISLFIVLLSYVMNPTVAYALTGTGCAAAIFLLFKGRKEEQALKEKYELE